MNAVGRQRSGAAAAAAAHHQRQYSDQFVEASSNGRWLQSAGLQHLQSSNNAVPPVQVNLRDFTISVDLNLCRSDSTSWNSEI